MWGSARAAQERIVFDSGSCGFRRGREGSNPTHVDSASCWTGVAWVGCGSDCPESGVMGKAGN